MNWLTVHPLKWADWSAACITGPSGEWANLSAVKHDPTTHDFSVCHIVLEFDILATGVYNTLWVGMDNTPMPTVCALAGQTATVPVAMTDLAPVTYQA